jgi:hypothetical protein
VATALPAALGTGGGSTPVGPQSVILPTPSFGSTNLLAWFDVGKTYTDATGTPQPSIYYDSLGYDSVSAWEDISGNGYLLNQPDKTFQPTKGSLGGPLFDNATAYLDFLRKSLFNGLPAVSIFASVRPVLNGGAAKRTMIYASEGNTSAIALSMAIAAGGTGYAVGDKIVLTGGTFSTAVTIVVNTVSGGVITSASIVNPGAYTVVPSNPVAQGSTTLYGSSTAGAGSGATFNMTFSTIGSGSAAERLSLYMSQGSTGRKPYITICPLDGTSATTSTTVSQSVGPANGGALSDTTTRRRVGYVIDTSAGTYQQYYEGAADGAAQTIATGALGTADSVILRLGNNNSPNSPLYMEIVRLIVLSEVPNSTRLGLIDTYLTSAL